VVCVCGGVSVRGGCEGAGCWVGARVVFLLSAGMRMFLLSAGMHMFLLSAGMHMFLLSAGMRMGANSTWAATCTATPVVQSCAGICVYA
jgi:hypothetical protein